MNNTNIFGNRLLKTREEHGETQDQLAEAIGITRQSLSRYEISDRTPNIEIVCNIARHYNISVDYLLGLSDIQNTDKNVETVCNITGLNEYTVSALMTSQKRKGLKGLSCSDVINFISGNGNLVSLTLRVKTFIDNIEKLYKIKEELYNKLPDYNIIDESFIVLQALDEESQVQDLCNKILIIQDKIEYNIFCIQKAVTDTVRIYEEEKKRDFNGKHNTPKE